MRTEQTDVLIIGAGPAGMVAALCLSRLGVSSILLERQPGLHTHPKAHELSGRSIEILGGLGVPFDELATEASPDEDASRILFCEIIGREFGCIDLKAQPDSARYRQHYASPAAYLNVSQVEVERVLVRHVRAQRHTELRYRHQWNALEQVGDAVVSQVSDMASGETYAVRSRYVIGADGAGSRCRSALGIDMIGPEKLQDFVSAYFEADLSALVTTPGKLYFIFSPEAPGVLIAHHIRKRWVFHTIVSTPHEKVEEFTPEVMRTRILAALGRPQIDLEIKSLSPWRMTAQVANRFRDRRVFLVGDAAHRYPPTGGLGMNSGIGDAHNLCWKLAAVLQGWAPENLLDSYELERRPVVQTLCDESWLNFQRMAEVLEAFGLKPEVMDEVARRMASGPIAALPSFGQAWIRQRLNAYGSRALARFRNAPEVERRVLEAIARQLPHFDRLGLDLGCTYQQGALLEDGTPPVKPEDPVRDYVPSTRPGARFPHFWLDGNARRRSSLELVDYERSTLVLGAACAISPDARPSLSDAAERYGVRIVSLGDPPIPLSYRGTVHTLGQIAPDGAIMIRPDGYVSWRQQAGVQPSAALIRSIIEETYHRLADPTE